MFKRIMALLLSLLMLVAVLPVGASAAKAEGQWLCQSIADHYVKTLEANETDTLNGLCGVLASYQLYFLGINTYPIMANGNDQYDCYLNRNYTDNGYRIKRYPAEDYTLEEALNAITHGGIWNAYNILIGFQATNTEAGSQFGHAVVIYGIVDGKVYFTESFGTSFVAEAGTPGICTISQFAALYDSWTVFEGAVLFGRKGYLDSCLRSDANMYVQVQREDPLYTQPCVPDTDEVESRCIRIARASEFLPVTAMYLNTLGRYYYQVTDGETVCYLDAQRAIPVRFNTEDVTVTDLEVPQMLTQGEDFTVKGKISSLNSLVSGLTMSVTDSNDQILLTHSRAKKSGTYDLEKDTFNRMIDFGVLEEGLYTFTLTADVLSTYLDEGVVETSIEKTTLCNVRFAVGENVQLPRQGRVAPAFIQDGWTLQDGQWCYYEGGMPRAGWFCYAGVDYYLQEDGCVTTGWTEINGKNRYFSSNGAMCTGWLHTEEGSYYLLKNGQVATGWRTVDNKLYYFGENGIMETGGWKTLEDKTYFLFADGSAATGWTTLKEGVFFFGEDGHLMVQAIGEGENTVYKAYIADEIFVPSLNDKET